MTWKDEIGPWDFTEQPNKFGYLNNPRWQDEPQPVVDYTGRLDEEPQIWTTEGSFSAGDSKQHIPCGHWHKDKGTSPLPGGSGFVLETFYEFLTMQSALVYIPADQDELVGTEMTVKIPTTAGEGEYTFEVIAKNSLPFSVDLVVFDTADFVCCTLTIPAESIGATKYELYRFTEEFIEGNGDYKLKIVKDSASGSVHWNGPDYELMIMTARVKLYQENPTSARIQIPMVGLSYNYSFIDDDDNIPYSAPVGPSIYNSYGAPDNLADFTVLWGTNKGIGGQRTSSIWSYNSDELSTVSQVILSVAIQPQELTSIERSTLIVSTWAQTGYDYVFYTAPSGTSSDVSNGIAYWVDETTSFIDENGVTFTPIPETYAYKDGLVIDEKTTLIVNQKLTTPLSTTFELHLGGVLYGYLGSEYGDPERCDNWGGLRTITLAAGEELFLDSISYTPGPTTLSMTMEYKFVIVSSAVPDIDVALWNITTDTIVTDSTLTWPAYSAYERKEAIIELASDCDYEIRCKCPGQTASMPGTDPQLIDAQLLIDIGPITAITTYNRLMCGFDGNRDNWSVPDTWGDTCTSSYIDEGSRNIGARITIDERVFSSIGFFYFEASGVVVGDYYDADCYSVLLDDLTDGDVTGSGATGSDVSDSTLTWDIIEGSRVKHRSNALTIEDAHIYSTRFLHADLGSFYISNGFLVCKYNVS